MKNRINKIGAALTILTFGLICAIGGYEMNSSTDANSSVLPITKGGTGANSAESARDSLSVHSKSYIDTKYANTGEKVTFNITMNSNAPFSFYANTLAIFVGYKQANGDIFGYAQIDGYLTIATGDFSGVTIASLPTGYIVAEKHQTVGSVWRTGTSGSATFLWSELDNPGTTTLLRAWNNNSSVPRNTDVRLMYNFPCVIRQA
ncbi:MAG: hypothetical protein LBB10_02920 [Bifidobacteriaceae bacterium]|nr:hypothetical protein [Bifidobacteriaceae bacterium]